MAEQAQVTSVEAIEIFRSQLVLYLSKVRPLLEEVGAEVMHTRFWVQNDRRQFWENELRLRGRKLEEAREALFNAKLSQFQQSTALQSMAVHRAELAVHETENKIAVLKKWGREMQNRTDPLVKQVEQLQGFLATDMVKATAYLSQIIVALEVYTDATPPAKSNPAPTDAGGSTP